MNAPAGDRWLIVFVGAWAVLAVASSNGETYSHKPPLLFWRGEGLARLK